MRILKESIWNCILLSKNCILAKITMNESANPEKYRKLSEEVEFKNRVQRPDPTSNCKVPGEEGPHSLKASAHPELFCISRSVAYIFCRLERVFMVIMMLMLLTFVMLRNELYKDIWTPQQTIFENDTYQGGLRKV